MSEGTPKRNNNGRSSQDDRDLATPKQNSGQNDCEFSTPKQNKSGRNSQNDPDLTTPKRSSGRSSQIDCPADSLKAANDDDAERHSRQQVILQELTAENLESPGTPSSRRRSMGIAPVTLTDVQLAEHYASCIRLATENKITIKNAFQLHLIDHLRKVLIASDGTTNFITAGCTLDASAKIYAHRVDYVYAEVFHIAGELGLGSRFRKRALKGRAAVDDDADPDKPQVSTKGAVKKSKRKASTLVRNEKTITLQKVETRKPVDPLEEYIRANSSTGSADCFTLNHINLFSDRGELAYLDVKRTPEPIKPSFTRSPIEFLRLVGLLKNRSATCPERALAYVWSDDSMEEERYDHYDASEPFFQFNASASIAATEELMPAMPSVCDGNDIGCEEAAPVDENNCSFEEEPVDILKNGISELAKYIAPEKREYSYFIDNAPAPNAAEYWRARMAEKAKKATKAPERKHKKAEKVIPLLDFEKLKPNPADFTRLKRRPALDKATRAAWKAENNTEPFSTDGGDEVALTKLILIGDTKITKFATKPIRLGNFGKRLHGQGNKDFCPDVNEDSNAYEDNGEDAPADAPEDAPADAPVDPPAGVPAVDPPAAQPAVNPPVVGPAVGHHHGLPDNFLKPLLPPDLKPIYDALGFKFPVKVQPSVPKFQHKYKRVDMKDMKQAIWQTLTSDKDNKANEGTKVDKDKTKEENKKNEPGAMNKPQDPSAMNKPQDPCAESKPEDPDAESKPEEAATSSMHSFRRMYKRLKPNLNRLNRENVSVPVAFVALLHLAAEKGFYVHSTDDLADLDIELSE